jgi:hypothetical protein
VDDIVDGAKSLVGSTLSGEDQILHQRRPPDVAHRFQKFVLDLVETQLVVFAPRNQLELAVIYALVAHAAAASPEELLGLVVSMPRKDGHRLDRAIHGSFRVAVLVVEE